MPTPSMGPVTSPVPHPTMKSSGLDADATQMETRRRRARPGPATVPGRVVVISLLLLLPRRRPSVRPVILPRRVIPADTGVAIAVDVMTRESGPSTGLFPRAASCEGTEARFAIRYRKRVPSSSLKTDAGCAASATFAPDPIGFVALARIRVSS